MAGYEDVIKNFLGNKKVQKYEIIVSKMLFFMFRDLGCKMSIKVQFFVQPPGQVPRKPWSRQ